MNELLYDLRHGFTLVELVEILNGILFPALLWMTFFLVLHFHRAWVITRETNPSLIGSLREIYVNYKPEIALLVIVSAFCLRTFVLWYLRWLRNNDMPWRGFLVEASSEFLVTFTGLIIVGAFCWIRVISPYTGKNAVALWFIMIITSVSFGIGMHYLF